MLRIDAARLRRSVLPALLAVLAALALISMQWAKRETASLAQARARLERRHQDDAAMANRRLDAQSAHARMQAWMRTGLFEPPDRFRWIGAVGRARTAAKLSSVDYEFAAAPIAIDHAPPSLSPRLTETQLTLRVRLAHEAQLLDFLRALDDEPAGVLRVRKCEIKRLADSSDRSASLDVHCDLSLFNARLTGAS